MDSEWMREFGRVDYCYLAQNFTYEESSLSFVGGPAAHSLRGVQCRSVRSQWFSQFCF
jgi:hypothetical protein